MDFRLKDRGCAGWPGSIRGVSILVLMDFRLKVIQKLKLQPNALGFNPCSNGLSAQRAVNAKMFAETSAVSILVLMDFRLKEPLGMG